MANLDEVLPTLVNVEKELPTPEAVRAEYVTLTPLGRIEEPEDVADIVLFLASDLSRFLTGEAVNASGGVLMD